MCVVALVVDGSTPAGEVLSDVTLTGVDVLCSV